MTSRSGRLMPVLLTALAGGCMLLLVVLPNDDAPLRTALLNNDNATGVGTRLLQGRDTVASADPSSQAQISSPLSSRIDTAALPDVDLHFIPGSAGDAPTVANCTFKDNISVPCTGEFDEVCVGGIRCPAHCMVRGGACLANVFLTSEPVTPSKYDEVVCVDRAPGRRPSVPADELDPVANFKHRTAWAFDQWWDWAATCTEPASDADAQYRAYVDEADREYVLENVCVNGVGGISGFNPNVTAKYDSRDELEYYIPPMNDFINNVRALPTRPRCFVDVDLILSVQDIRAENNAHAFHRFAQVALMQRYHFPKPQDPPHAHRHGHQSKILGNRSTVVGHVWLHDLFETGPGNSLRYFMPMMGDAWFSVFGDVQFAKSARALQRVGGDAGLAQLSNTSLCFRKARVAHACIVPHCSGQRIETRASEQFMDSPGRRYKMSYVTPRTSYDTLVLHWLRNKVGSCVGVTPRESADVASPTVMIAVRSHNRRFSQQALHAYELVRYVTTKHGARGVAFVEFSRLLPNTVLRMHLNLDVLVGAFGSALGWVAIMPRGGVLMEMVGRDYGCPAESPPTEIGFYRPAECEYAGYAAARGARQFHHSLFPQRHAVYNFTPSRWKFVRDTAVCALRWEPRFAFTFPFNDTINLMTTNRLRAAYRGLIDRCETPFDNLTIGSW